MYHLGPTAANNQFVLGKFALCSVRITESNASADIFCLHNDDYLLCERLVAEAEAISDYPAEQGDDSADQEQGEIQATAVTTGVENAVRKPRSGPQAAKSI